MGKFTAAGFILILLCLGAGCDDTSYPFIVAQQEVEIQYSIYPSGTVDVVVTNSFMTVVRTLVDGEVQPEGANSVVWDLMDDSGDYPGDGLYTVEVWLEGSRVFVQVLEVNRQ